MQDEIFNIIEQLTGNKNLLVCPKIYVELTGSHESGIVLNQCIYWNPKTKRKDGYFYKTLNEWSEETVISNRTLSRIFKKLKAKNLIDTKIIKADGFPTLHIKVNKNEVYQGLIRLCQSGNIDLAKMSNQFIPSCQSGENDLAKMAKSLTDITTDINNIHDNTKHIASKKTPDKSFILHSMAIPLSESLAHGIIENCPNFRELQKGHSEKTIERWAIDIDKMIRLDNRDPAHISCVISWCQKDSFWSGNIHSGKKLREKYDTLSMQMKRNNGKSIPNEKPTATEIAQTQLAAAIRRM